MVGQLEGEEEGRDGEKEKEKRVPRVL